MHNALPAKKKTQKQRTTYIFIKTVDVLFSSTFLIAQHRNKRQIELRAFMDFVTQRARRGKIIQKKSWKTLTFVPLKTTLNLLQLKILMNSPASEFRHTGQTAVTIQYL